MAKQTLEVYTIVQPRSDGARAYWLKIGSAWVNKDRSVNVKLNALPLDGQLQIRKPSPKVGGGPQGDQ